MKNNCELTIRHNETLVRQNAALFLCKTGVVTHNAYIVLPPPPQYVANTQITNYRGFTPVFSKKHIFCGIGHHYLRHKGAL